MAGRTGVRPAQRGDRTLALRLRGRTSGLSRRILLEFAEGIGLPARAAVRTLDEVLAATEPVLAEWADGGRSPFPPELTRRRPPARDPHAQPAAGRGAIGRGAGTSRPRPFRVSALLVVDASVALKWVVDEPGSDAATALLADLAADAVSLAAPEQLLGEVGNGLRKRVAQGVLSADLAQAALGAVAEVGLELIGGHQRGCARCPRP